MAQLANEKGWIEIVIIIPALAAEAMLYMYLLIWESFIIYIRVILGH